MKPHLTPYLLAQTWMFEEMGIGLGSSHSSSVFRFLWVVLVGGWERRSCS